jgi:hypothetical protein
MLQLLWKVQFQTQYTPVQLRPRVCVCEDPAEFHPQEATGCHQEGEDSHKILAIGLYTY